MEIIFDKPTARERAGAAPYFRPGVVLGDCFRVLEFAGETAYGEVYRAVELARERPLLIQAITPALVGDAGLRSRLERQAEVAVKLKHKNIVETCGLFAMPGSNVIYLVEEETGGHNLREMLERKRAGGRCFSLKSAYNVVAHLCNALTYAHTTIAHGAILADAVWVSPAGRVKLGDFGLGGILVTLEPVRKRMASGSPALAPEVLRGEAVDARTDIYSLGALLYELLTGRTPAPGLEPANAVAASVPVALAAVIARCVRPSRAERYASAQKLKQAVQTAIAGELAALDAAPPPDSSAAHTPPASPKGRAPSALRPTAGAAGSPSPRPTPGPRPSSPAPVPAVPPGPISSSPPPRLIPIPQAHPTPVALRSSASAATPPPGLTPAPSSAVDEAAERWLIRKDRLDFGPFSLRDVRSQIEGGQLRGEHTVIDTESGERRAVRDHPLLRQLALECEQRFAERAREQAEVDERRRHKHKVVALLGIMLAVVLAVAGGVTWYVLHLKPRTERVIVHDKADLDFLKNIEITMKVDPPVKRGPAQASARHRGKGNRPGAFDEATNLGDVSQSGGDETLDEASVQKVMSSNFKVLVGCIAEERRRNPGLHKVDMDFIIKGSGQVQAVRVNGETSTPFAGCMYGKMQTVAFPKFNGQKTHAAFSLALK